MRPAHDGSFANVLDYINDEWSSRPASSAELPMMAEGCTAPRNRMEIPIHLFGHQGKEADLLHDDAFAGVLDRIGDE